MADRLEKTSGQQLSTEAQEGLGELRRQIEAHRKHDSRRSYLSQAVGIFWREDDRSLSKIEDLYKQATGESHKQSNGQAGSTSADLKKEIARAIEADRQAVARHDTYSHYATGALKSAALFMPGRTGLAATVITQALDQASAHDSFKLQMTDGMLGAAKGGLMRGAFHLLGKTELGIAAKGIGLGVSSRAIETAFTRQNYVDEAGNLNLIKAGSKLSDTMLNRQALITDVATLAAAHGLFGKLDFAFGGVIQKSPLLSNIATASTFGFSSGAAGEIIRQQNAGEAFDLGKVLNSGSIQGLIDAAATVPGGFQARSMAARLESEASRREPAGALSAHGQTAGEISRIIDESGRLIIPVARQLEYKGEPVPAPDRLPAASSDASQRPGTPQEDQSLALRGSDFRAATSKLTLLPGEQTEWFATLKEGTTGPFASEKDFTDKSIIYTAEKVRAYQIAGVETRLIFTEDYAGRLDEVRRLRAAEAELNEQFRLSPGDAQARSRWLAAIDKVGQHPMSNHPVPEDFVDLLDRLPDKTLVKKLIVVDGCAPNRPYYEQVYGKGFEAAATASREGVITFFKPRRGSFIGETVPHEWSHLVDFALPEVNYLFSLAAELERKGFYARHYARYNDAENLAVHLGEELLNSEPARFMNAARQAPLRSTILMLNAVEPVLHMVPEAQRSRFHEQLSNRVAWQKENILPEARSALIKNILSGCEVERRQAIELLMTWDSGGRWVDSLIGQKALKALDLSRTALTDEEGAFLNKLSKHPILEELKLGYNELSDRTLEAVGSLSGLRSLSLVRTDVTDAGVEAISRLSELRSLNLMLTKVTDAAVARLADRLKQLHDLKLPASGSITDAAAPHLAKLERLSTLRLGGKNITDQSLEHLKALKHLIELDVASSSMSDFGILHILEMRGVYKLSLSGNITDEGARLLAEKTDLHTLNLSYTKITDAGVEALYKLKYLACLRLDDCKITGSGLARLSSLDGLGLLSLNSTPVEDYSPASVRKNHPRLQELELSNCYRISDRGINLLSGHEGLKKIKLSHNRKITSASGNALASMPALEDINLSHTDFGDEGVKAIAGMAHLQTLDLSGTKVTDACLSELKKLNWLRELNLKHCGLSYGAVADLRVALPHTKIIF